MKFKGAVATGLLAIALANPTSACAPHPLKDNCQHWFDNQEKAIGTEQATWELHTWGCHAPYGHWIRGTSRCNKIAYQLERKDKFSLVGVGRHHCVLYEDGAWDNE